MNRIIGVVPRAMVVAAIAAELALPACRGTIGGLPATGGGSGGAAGSSVPAPGREGAGGGLPATGAGGTGRPTGDAGAAAPDVRDGAMGTGVGGRDGGAGEAGAPPVTAKSCKRGEAYGGHSVPDLQALQRGITWWYNWATSPDRAVAADYERIGVEYVPMIWGGDPDPATIERQIPATASYLLTFNEPNFGAQSHIPAAQAAALWPKIEQIARDKNLKIVSPAVNYCAGDCNDTDPIHYLDTFFAACTGCQVDYIAAHWYACTGDALTTYLARLKKYGKPIWLTEFSCLDAGDHSVAGEEAYMKTAVGILESDPMVFRYAWFTGRFASTPGVNLLGTSGTLTDVGNLYMTLPSSLPSSGLCGP